MAACIFGTADNEIVKLFADLRGEGTVGLAGQSSEKDLGGYGFP
jgi:hypothetical protein